MLANRDTANYFFFINKNEESVIPANAKTKTLGDLSVESIVYLGFS